MIIVVASQKGGPGKSTIVTNLAVQLSSEGHRVCIVDADPQPSTSRWAADREENGLPQIMCVQKVGSVTSTLTELNESYDIVLVDTPGKDSAEMRTAMVAADQLVVVVRPSQFDLDTLPHLSNVITDAMHFNPGLRVRGLLSQVSTHTFGAESDDATDYLADYPLFKPFTTRIHERKAYRDVIGEGRGVVEWNNRKAAGEILALTKELMAND